jgi:hypothetical protein
LSFDELKSIDTIVVGNIDSSVFLENSPYSSGYGNEGIMASEIKNRHIGRKRLLS